MIDDAEGFIESYVLPMNEAEDEYLAQFALGEYDPSLLFNDAAIVAAALASPKAKWKLENLKKMR